MMTVMMMKMMNKAALIIAAVFVATAAAASQTLAPTSFTSTLGSLTSQGVPPLAAASLVGAQDVWDDYVELHPPAGQSFDGVFIYPTTSLDVSRLDTSGAAAVVRANFMGSGDPAYQNWFVSAYSWTSNSWVSIGDTALAVNWNWSAFAWTLPGTTHSQWNDATNGVRLRVQSSNGVDVALFDQLVIELTEGAVAGPSCVQAGDCTVPDACTVATCDGGVCLLTPVDCDDGNLCTTDACSDGSCSNTPIQCPGSTPCLQRACDALTGSCQSQPVVCSDGNPCTIDSCDVGAGGCQHVPDTCNDANPCTTDSCDSTRGCVNEPIPNCTPPCTQDSECSPLQACHTSRCAIGVCIEEPMVCDDGDVCTADSCVNSVCVHSPIISAACLPPREVPVHITGFSAVSGTRTSQALTVCNVKDQSGAEDEWANYFELHPTPLGTPFKAHFKAILPGDLDRARVTGFHVVMNTKGSLGAYQTWYVKAVRNDGSTAELMNTLDNTSGWTGWSEKTATLDVAAGTFGQDYVDGSTGEMTLELSDNNGADVILVDYLHIVVRESSPPPSPQCVQATDCPGYPPTDACMPITCDNGVCVQQVTNCDDGRPCTVDSCDSSTGQCANVEIQCPQTPCSQGYCDDATTNGNCATRVPDCDDSDACTVDTCVIGSGCVHNPVNCDDSNACTDDSCNPISGCVNEPITGCVPPCNSAADCTGAPDLCHTATCSAGQCSYAPIVCDDNDACTSDACNVANGACEHTRIVSTTCVAPQDFVLPATDFAATQGSKTSQSLNALAIRDQSGTQDEWERYVEFHPEGYPTVTTGTFDGIFSFRVPDTVTRNAVTQVRLNGNYQGSSDSYQAWQFQLQNHAAGTWEDLGTQGTAGGGWAGWFAFAHDVAIVSGAFSQYVDAASDMQVRLSTGLGVDVALLDELTLTVSVTTTPQTCTVVGDCTAPDLCQIATCNSGTCSFAPRTCDDGLVCTDDSCDASTGACRNIDRQCAGDACNAGICSPISGQCTTAPVDCSDNNACTNDSCNTSSGCVNDPVLTGSCAPCSTVADCSNPVTATCRRRACIAGQCGEEDDPACQGQALPDLTIDIQRLRSTMEAVTRNFGEGSCAINEGCTLAAGNRNLIRFDTSTPNIGTADLNLGAPSGGSHVWDTCHNHWHFPSYVRYTLKDSNGVEIPGGWKQAFCLMDTGQWSGYQAARPDPAGPPPATTSRFNCSNQGIQRGWMDTYAKYLDCQWIDVTDLAPGDYTLNVHINPPDGAGNHGVAELRYDNNEFDVPFSIPFVPLS